MKAAIFILLYFLIFRINFVNLKQIYEIGKFINYLQSEGYYDVIYTVKDYLGDDIAISTCKEFVKSAQCDSVVKIYMVTPNKPHSICDGKGRKILQDILTNYSDIISDELKEKIENRISSLICGETK